MISIITSPFFENVEFVEHDGTEKLPIFYNLKAEREPLLMLFQLST